MSKPILCLDFDGVIHSYTSGWKGEEVVSDPPVDGALSFIIAAQETFTVAIYSSRSKCEEGIEAMQRWLRMHMAEYVAGLEPNFSDVVLDRILNAIYWARDKPSAMVTLDDRALNFDGVWPAIEDLRRFKPWNKREKAQ